MARYGKLESRLYSHRQNDRFHAIQDQLDPGEEPVQTGFDPRIYYHCETCGDFFSSEYDHLGSRYNVICYTERKLTEYAALMAAPLSEKYDLEA